MTEEEFIEKVSECVHSTKDFIEKKKANKRMSNDSLAEQMPLICLLFYHRVEDLVERNEFEQEKKGEDQCKQ